MINTIIHGNNIEVLQAMEENSVDSIVTDAPYGLGKEPDPVKVMKAWAECGHYDVPGKGFMGKQWDAFVPQPAFWKEAFRVLKPGGHVLCFFGTRTYDWGVMAMRFAGFEIRDCLQWLYGSGFPKSLDISKAIDKEAGYWRGRAGDVIIESQASKGKEYERSDKGDPVTDAAAAWHGYGTALKPSVEPIVLSRKPISEKTIAANVLKWGTGGLWIDGCRVGTEEIETQAKAKGSSFTSVGEAQGYNGCDASIHTGRFPANLLLDEEAAAELDKQSGILTSGASNESYIQKESANIAMSGKNYERSMPNREASSWGASRFFKVVESDAIECAHCYVPLNKANNKEWKELIANSAEINFQITHQTIANTAAQNVTQIQKEQLVQIVKYVGNLCDSCAIHFVQEAVKMYCKKESLELIQDFIKDCNKCSLIQNLASYVQSLENIDITPTTINHLKLFGYVNHAIINYIKETKKSGQNRFLYTAKTSRNEREQGVRWMTKQPSPNNLSGGTETRLDGAPVAMRANIHPTVKPLDLMQYLVRLITPKGGVCLDPFAGSGTTCIAAKLENMQYIGIELEQEYATIAQERIKSYHTQLTIF